METVINATGSDHPSIQDLNNHMLPEAAPKWKELGENLSLKLHVLQNIGAQHKENAKRCCEAMFTEWLQAQEDASWNQLLLALRNVQLATLADRLEQVLPGTEKYLERLYYQAKHDLGSEKLQLHKLLIFGPPGAGKSSLLNVLVGDEPDTERNSTGVLNRKLVQYKVAITASHNRGLKPPWLMVKIEDEIQRLRSKIKKKLTASTIVPPCILPDQQKPRLRVEDAIFPKSAHCPRAKPDDTSSTQVQLEQTTTLIACYDSGGQPEFFDVMPALTTAPTGYVMVFDISKDLYTKCEGFYKKGKNVSSENYAPYTSVELMKTALANIQSYTKTYDTIYQNISAKFSNYGQLLVVGTHLDLCGDTEEQKTDKLLQAEKHMEENILNIPVDSLRIIDCPDDWHSTIIYPISNVVKEDRDDNAQKIRIAIEKMSESEKIENYVPINWLLFQLEIRLTKKNCISRRQCIDIASECYIQEKDVNDILLYFHELGILLHYRNVDALKDVIFCNPQWLFDQLTKLIEWKYKRSHQHKKSINKGIFDKKILIEMHRDFDGDDVLRFEQLLQLFVSLNIMAVLPGETDQYFMPALLNPAPPGIDKNLLKCYGSKMHDTLLVKFENRYFPRGIVCCLVAEFMNTSGWNIQYNEAVYKDLIIFEVSEKQYIFIRDNIDSIAVEMYRQGGDDHCKINPLAICEKLSMTLKEVCKKINITSDFKFGFSCNCFLSDGVLCNGFSGVKDSLPFKEESFCEKCQRRSSLKSKQTIWLFSPPKVLPKVTMQSQPNDQHDGTLLEPIDLMMILKLQKDLFTDNLHFIVQNLNPNDIIDQLISEHLVGQSAREQLKLPQKTNQEKNYIIVDELSRGPPGTLEKILYILRNTSGGTNFKTIADKLEKDWRQLHLSNNCSPFQYGQTITQQSAGWSVNIPNEDLPLDNSSVSRILNTEPKMVDLSYIVIKRIKEYWDYTAYALEFSIDDVEDIKVKCNQEDSKKCCLQVFIKWLNTTNACGVKPKTWSVLLSQLEKVEEIMPAIIDEIKSDIIKLPL